MANEIRLRLIIDGQEAIATLDRSEAGILQNEEAAGQLDGAFARIRETAVGMGLASLFESAVGAVSNLVAESEAAYLATEKVNSTTRQLIQNLGSDAGTTFEELERISGEMENKSLFGAPDIMEASQALIGFRNIHGETFDRAMALSLDLASQTGDLEGSYQTVARSLANPERAVRRLERANIGLSETQEEAIELLAASGREAEAQGVILDALQGSVGGFADSMEDNADVQLSRFEDELGAVQEELGELLVAMKVGALPLLTAFSGALSTGIGFLKDTHEFVGENRDIITIWATALTAATVALNVQRISLVAAGTVTRGYAIATNLATVATRAFSVAIRANPIGLIVSGLIAVGAAIATYTVSTGEATDETVDFEAELEKATAAAGKHAESTSGLDEETQAYIDSILEGIEASEESEQQDEKNIEKKDGLTGSLKLLRDEYDKIINQKDDLSFADQMELQSLNDQIEAIERKIEARRRMMELDETESTDIEPADRVNGEQDELVNQEVARRAQFVETGNAHNNMMSRMTEGEQRLLEFKTQAAEKMAGVFESVNADQIDSFAELANTVIDEAQRMIGAEIRLGVAAAVRSALASAGPLGIVLAPAAGLAAQVMFNKAISAIGVPEFREGGLVSGGEQIVRLNEDGEEFVMNADSTRRMKPLLEAANNSPDLAGMMNDFMAAQARGEDTTALQQSQNMSAGLGGVNISLVNKISARHLKDELEIFEEQQKEIGNS